MNEPKDKEIHKSGVRKITLEVSEANASRIANALTVTAQVALEEDQNDFAALQALQIRKEVQKQIRGQ